MKTNFFKPEILTPISGKIIASIVKSGCGSEREIRTGDILQLPVAFQEALL